jgi:6-phosphogluconolactonase (cycloisomerase 2 family)
MVLESPSPGWAEGNRVRTIIKLGGLALAIGLAATACHVGGGYTVGGTVTGLRGSGLVLQLNGGNNLGFSSSGTFTFSSGIDQGGAYSVSVLTQPSGQSCSVHNGSGTIGTADISNVIVNCSGPGSFAYVANQSSNSISAYAIDASTGALTEIAGSPFASTGTGPVAVTVDPNGAYLYAANNASATVSVYAIDADTGALSAVGQPVDSGNGPFAVLVDPSDQFLYVINKTDNTVSVFETGSGGALTSISGSPFSVGSEPTSLATDPGGNFLYVTDYAQNAVAVFSIEPGGGALVAIGGSPFAAGSGALSVAIDPTGTFAYVANETGHSVSLYSVNVDTGALAALSGSPISQSSQAESVAVDPTGKFLLVSTSGNELSSYAITPASGALTAVSTVGTGTFPVNVVINPQGTFAYVANANSADISVYAINATTGALTQVAGSPFGAGDVARSIAID